MWDNSDAPVNTTFGSNDEWGTQPGSALKNFANENVKPTRVTNKEVNGFPDSSDSVPRERASGACRGCGKEGHLVRDCPDKPPDDGNCRACGKEGHFAKDCPDKPPEGCKNCGEEGHKVAECKNPRKVDWSGIEDKEIEVAWNELVMADSRRDMDDVRDAMRAYVKALKDTTWSDLEKAFRNHSLKVHLIAYEKEVSDTHTLMDLQGNLGRKFHVGYYWSSKPQRGVMKEGWPSSPEENLERLKNAGEPVDTKIPKCHKCGQLGHTSKGCSEEGFERTSERPVIKCVNCDEEGHRARDCTQPRKDKFSCRNCGSADHKAIDCTEPRSAANVECKHCGEMGHFVRDCPTKPQDTCRNCGEEGHRSKECENPANPDLIVCRNCDEKGHMSKDCPKPRDYSRVKCSNCDKMGHTKIRCKEPPKLEKGAGFGNAGEGLDSGFGTSVTNNFGGGEDSKWDVPVEASAPAPKSSSAADAWDADGGW